MQDLTAREKMAMRILSVMFKIIAPDREHSFKNDEMIKFIFGEDQ